MLRFAGVWDNLSLLLLLWLWNNLHHDDSERRDVAQRARQPSPPGYVTTCVVCAALQLVS